MLDGVDRRQRQMCIRDRAGRPQGFLSVLMPLDEGENVDRLVKKIKTSVKETGAAMASIGETQVTVAADGIWNVKR